MEGGGGASPSLSDLSRRVSRLEHYVGYTPGNESLVTRVTQVYSKVQEVLQQISSFSSFFEQCLCLIVVVTCKRNTHVRVDDALGDQFTERTLNKQRNSLSSDAKLELLMAAEKRMQAHAKQLKQLAELTKYINPEPLQGWE